MNYDSTAAHEYSIACVIAAAPGPAGAEDLVRQHLDAGRVQFSGMDINSDGIADSIRLDRIKQSLNTQPESEPFSASWPEASTSASRKGTIRSWVSPCSPGEAKAAILERARNTLFPGP